MAQSRLSLHEKLLEVLKEFYDEDKWNELLEKDKLPCYFEPPASIQLTYPCIVYHYEGNRDDRADNIRYRKFRRYSLIVIDYDPDSEIHEKVIDAFNHCSMDRRYTSDNLEHFALTLYY